MKKKLLIFESGKAKLNNEKIPKGQNCREIN